MQAGGAGVFPSVPGSGMFGSSSLMNDVTHAVSVTDHLPDCLQHLGMLTLL